MAIKEIAEGLVELCKKGEFREAINRYYAADIVSVEAMPDTPEAHGIDAIHAKTEWWEANMEVHSIEVTGPYLNGDQFAVRFQLDCTEKEKGKRSTIDEVAIYTVREDKIVHERFFY